MVIRIWQVVCALLMAVFCLNAAADEVQTFTLKGVRSGEEYGPFTFRRGTVLKLESGVFRLSILADNKAFVLTDSASGVDYGVYELLLGRIIDIGDVFFTITGVTAPPQATAAAAAGYSIFGDTEFAIGISLLNEVPYNWEINGVAGEEDQSMIRRNLVLSVRKGIFTMQLGLITESEWDHTIPGGEGSFRDAEMVNGSGWFVGAGLHVPVFEEGRWKAHIHGEAVYRREELSLRYGTWEIESIVSTVDTVVNTNDVTITNSVSTTTTTTNLRFNLYDKPATLTETLVSLGAQISYNAPSWFLYAGIKAFPWGDISLDAVITSDDRKYRIEFTRRDPVTAYGGIGLEILKLRSFLEVEGGGENAVRLGISRAF